MLSKDPSKFLEKIKKPKNKHDAHYQKDNTLVHKDLVIWKGRQ